MSETDWHDIQLCFEEAFINSVKHGNKNALEKIVNVQVQCQGPFVELCVTDQGEAFDPGCCEDPTHAHNIMKTAGRGVYLIQKLMDEVTFEDGGRCIRIRKRLRNRKGQ